MRNALLLYGLLGVALLGVGCADEVEDDALVSSETPAAGDGETAAEPSEVPGLAVGDPAPELVFTDVIDAPEEFPDDAKLDNFSGELVVLEFSESWCPPCQASVPHFNELVAEFEGQPVTFITASSEPIEAIEKFDSDYDINSALVQDEGGVTAIAYGLIGYPTVYIIGKDGTLVWTGHPQELTSDVINTHLGA